MKEATCVRRELSGVTTCPRFNTPSAATTPKSRISQKATSPRLAPTERLGSSLAVARAAPGPEPCRSHVVDLKPLPTAAGSHSFSPPRLRTHLCPNTKRRRRCSLRDLEGATTRQLRLICCTRALSPPRPPGPHLRRVMRRRLPPLFSDEAERAEQQACFCGQRPLSGRYRRREAPPDRRYRAESSAPQPGLQKLAWASRNARATPQRDVHPPRSNVPLRSNSNSCARSVGQTLQCEKSSANPVIRRRIARVGYGLPTCRRLSVERRAVRRARACRPGFTEARRPFASSGGLSPTEGQSRNPAMPRDRTAGLSVWRAY